MRTALHRGFAPTAPTHPGDAADGEVAVLLSADSAGALLLRSVLQAQGIEVRLGPAMDGAGAAIVATGRDLAGPQGRHRLALLRRHLPAVPLFVVDEAALAHPAPAAIGADGVCEALAASGLGRFV